MKRKISLFLASVLVFCGLLSGVSCGKSDNSGANSSGGGAEEGEYHVASCLKKAESGRMYIEVSGEPMLYTGAQVRIDGYVHLDQFAFDEMEEQFEKAASMHVNTVQLPICWKDLEREEGVYNFRQIRQLLEWGVKYGLHIEILWFTYQTGGIYCPDYIFEDEERFPKYLSDNKGQVYDLHGKQGYLVYTTPELLERERLVIKELTDFIYDWEKENNFPNVVTGYQLHNEADNFPRWGISQQHVMLPDGSRALTDKEAWRDVLTAYNNAGMAFKTSKWRALTRANLTTLTATVGSGTWKAFAPRVFNLEGVDMIGDDTYTDNIAAQTSSMKIIGGEEFEGNLPHVAENAANYKNTASLLLSAIASGSGYLMYCLQLPYYYVANESNWEKWEQGVFDTDGNEKEHTAQVRSMEYGLKYAGAQLAVASVDDIAAFNVDTDYPLETTEQMINTTAVTLNFSTESGAIGYAVYYNGYLTAYSTAETTLKLGNADFSAAEYGEFTGYEFAKSGEVSLENGNILNMEGGKVYRIKAENIKGALVSDTQSFIG